jgi:hypothetical protein
MQWLTRLPASSTTATKSTGKSVDVTAHPASRLPSLVNHVWTPFDPLGVALRTSDDHKIGHVKPGATRTTAKIQERAGARCRESVDRRTPVFVPGRPVRARSRPSDLWPEHLEVRIPRLPPRYGRGGRTGAGVRRSHERFEQPGDTRTPTHPPRAKPRQAPRGRLRHKPDAEPRGRHQRSSPPPPQPTSARSARASIRCPSRGHPPTAAPQRRSQRPGVCPRKHPLFTTRSTAAAKGRLLDPAVLGGQPVATKFSAGRLRRDTRP